MTELHTERYHGQHVKTPVAQRPNPSLVQGMLLRAWPGGHTLQGRTEQSLEFGAADPLCPSCSPSCTRLPTGETGQGSTIAISLFANAVIGVTVLHFHDPQ